jgi:hypothetical protein
VDLGSELAEQDGSPLREYQLASIHLRESRSEKEIKVFYEWSASPQFDEDSYVLFQVYPALEIMATLKISFSAVQIKRVTPGGKQQSTTISELRKEVVERKQ